MICLKTEYKVKSEYVAEVKRAIAEFVAAVHEKESGTKRYEAYVHPDGVSFTHLMAFENKTAEELHRNTPHVKKFVSVLYPVCEHEPVFTRLERIGETSFGA